MTAMAPGRYILILLCVLLVVMVLLVAKTSAPLSRLAATNKAFSQLEQKDDDIELALLQIHAKIVLHYDDLRYLDSDINLLYSELGRLLVTEGPQIRTEMQHLNRQLLDKQTLIEQFKSDFSILRNSLTYLPEIFAQSIKAIDRKGVKTGVETRVETRVNSDEKQQLMTVEGLFFRHFVAAKPNQVFLAYMNLLQKKHPNDEQWQNIFLHIEHALNKQANINKLLKKIKKHPAKAQIRYLHELYANQLDSQLKQQTQAIYAAGVITVLLLLFSIWTLIQYQRINRQIHDLNDHLENRIVQATRDILAEKQKVEDAGQAREQFLTRMFHELRTPLNAIIGFAHVQQMSSTNSAKVVQYTEHILHAGKHLLGLLNNMLDIDQLGQAETGLKIENCCLTTAINQSIELIKRQAKNRDISINYVPAMTSVQADNHRLNQVLVNLLTNAIKYNRIGGTIAIVVTGLPSNQVEITIKDSGVGIDKKDQQIIFEPFTRLAYAERHEIQGTGIGLALSKILIKQMHGSIGLHSEIDKGSSFWFRLPKGTG